MMEAHSLRCEKIDKYGFCPFGCEIRTPIKDENGTLLYYTCYHKLEPFIHSSAKSDAVLDEQIELLRKIEDELFKCIYIRGMEITVVNSLFSKYIEELRRKKNEI